MKAAIMQIVALGNEVKLILHSKTAKEPRKEISAPNILGTNSKQV
jgi:hypothetical protein